MSEEQLRQTLGDAGWRIVELTTITMPIDAEKIDAVLWMLRATREDAATDQEADVAGQ